MRSLHRQLLTTGLVTLLAGLLVFLSCAEKGDSLKEVVDKALNKGNDDAIEQAKNDHNYPEMCRLIAEVAAGCPYDTGDPQMCADPSVAECVYNCYNASKTCNEFRDCLTADGSVCAAFVIEPTTDDDDDDDDNDNDDNDADDDTWTPLFFEDWESYSAGSVPHAPWIIDGRQLPASAAIVEKASSKVLEIADQTGFGYVSMHYPLIEPVEHGELRVSCDARGGDSNVNGVDIAISDLAWLSLAGSRIYGSDGDGNGGATVCDCGGAGGWEELAITVDLDYKSWRISVDGTVTCNGLGFMSSSGQATTVRFGTGDSTRSTAWFDNIRIEGR